MQGFYCKYCEIFKNSFLQNTSGSYFWNQSHVEKFKQALVSQIFFVSSKCVNPRSFSLFQQKFAYGKIFRYQTQGMYHWYHEIIINFSNAVHVANLSGHLVIGTKHMRSMSKIHFLKVDALVPIGRCIRKGKLGQ